MTIECADPNVDQLVDAARAIDGLHVEEYPQRSWLHDGDPVGWSISWESWSMTVVPTPTGVWVVAYTDDDGLQLSMLPPYALDFLKVNDPDSVKEAVRDAHA